MILNCTYSEPKSIGVGGVEQVAKVGDNFQYKKSTCTYTNDTATGSIYTTITNATGQTYELSKSFTYGDLLLSGLTVTLFIMFMSWGIYLLTFRRKY
jgi:hypothetical protein